jgi:chromosome partitioning protein
LRICKFAQNRIHTKSGFDFCVQHNLTIAHFSDELAQENKMIKLAITNQKGGVGKTTIAFNLAQILAERRGTKVLAIDNDPQGNLTSSFLENPTELKGNILNAYEEKALEPERISKSLDFLGSNISLAPVAERDFQIIFRLKESIEKLQNTPSSKTYDYVVIDCLPSFGHLHLAALNAADYVVVPVKPSPYALAGMKDLFDTIGRVKKYFNPNIQVLGIIINQVDGRKLVMEREMEEALRENYGNLVLKSKISKRIKVEESPAFQKAITEYNAQGPAAKEFKALTQELLQRIHMKEHELPIFSKK